MSAQIQMNSTISRAPIPTETQPNPIISVINANQYEQRLEQKELETQKKIQNLEKQLAEERAKSMTYCQALETTQKKEIRTEASLYDLKKTLDSCTSASAELWKKKKIDTLKKIVCDDWDLCCKFLTGPNQDLVLASLTNFTAYDSPPLCAAAREILITYQSLYPNTGSYVSKRFQASMKRNLVISVVASTPFRFALYPIFISGTSILPAMGIYLLSLGLFTSAGVLAGRSLKETEVDAAKRAIELVNATPELQFHFKHRCLAELELLKELGIPEPDITNARKVLEERFGPIDFDL